MIAKEDPPSSWWPQGHAGGAKFVAGGPSGPRRRADAPPRRHKLSRKARRQIEIDGKHYLLETALRSAVSRWCMPFLADYLGKFFPTPLTARKLSIR